MLCLSLIQAPSRMMNREGMGFAVVCPITLETGLQMCSSPYVNKGVCFRLNT